MDFTGGPDTLAKFQEAFIEGGKDAAIAEHKRVNLVGLRRAQSVASLELKSRVAEMPPVWLCAGGIEAFRDDVVQFGEFLKEQGVTRDEDVHVGKDMPHIYPCFWPLFRPESTNALNLAADFCVRAWNVVVAEGTVAGVAGKPGSEKDQGKVALLTTRVGVNP